MRLTLPMLCSVHRKAVREKVNVESIVSLPYSTLCTLDQGHVVAER